MLKFKKKKIITLLKMKISQKPYDNIQTKF